MFIEPHLFLLALAILLAAVLQSGTGFGFSLLSMPFLLLAFDLRDAIQINLILSVLLSLFIWRNIKDELDIPFLKKLIIGSTILIFPGLVIYSVGNASFIKWVIGIILLLVTFLLLIKVRIHRSTTGDYVTGALSGLFTTSIGMSGPPILVYLSGSDSDKALLRSTTLAYYIYIYLISLILHVAFHSTSGQIWINTLLMLPAALVGMVIGNYLYRILSKTLFYYLLYLILFATAAIMLFQ